MRDINRIDKFLRRIEEMIEQKPELTIGKIIIAVDGSSFIYGIEEDKFIETAEKNLSLKTTGEGQITNQSLKDISEVWKKLPDLRFGQLITNMVSNPEILDKVPDDLMADAVSKYYNFN